MKRYWWRWRPTSQPTPIVDTMPVECLWRWPNNKPALAQHLAFTVIILTLLQYNKTTVLIDSWLIVEGRIEVFSKNLPRSSVQRRLIVINNCIIIYIYLNGTDENRDTHIILLYNFSVLSLHKIMKIQPQQTQAVESMLV